MRLGKIILLLFVTASLYCQKNTTDSLKQLLRQVKHDTSLCNVLYALIESENDINIWPNYNKKLKHIAEKNLATNPSYALKCNFQKHLAFAYNNIGYLAQINGDNKKALANFNLALLKYNEIKHMEGVALSLNNLGYVYQTNGQVEKSLDYYRTSYEVYRLRKDKDGEATALNNIANVTEQYGNIPKALEHYHQSLNIREEIGDKEGIAICLNNIGAINKTQGNFNDAISYIEKALKIQKEVNDEYGIAYSYNNIGGIYELMQNLNKAKEYYELSLALRKKINDINGYAFSLNNMGSIYNKLGDNRKALEYHTKSYEILQSLDDMQGQSYALNNIALIQEDNGNYKEAELICLKSIEIARKLGFPDILKSSTALLTEIYKKQNKGIQALEMYQLHVKMRDSLNNMVTQKAALRREFQYKYEKKALRDSVVHARETQLINIELEMKKTEIRARRYQQYALYGGLGLVLIFALFMYNRFKVTHKQKEIIELKEKETQFQKKIIEEKQKEIVDSINYAKRIQYALLAHNQLLDDNIPNHFIYFNPKDIVSGDFYWATKKGNKFYLAVCDSTGHGVPGAFMSLLNISFLNEAITERNILEPHEILNYARQRLIDNISKEDQKDGFDGIVICFEYSSDGNQITKVTYAAGNNSPLLISNGNVVELYHDRMPIGIGERKEPFKLNSIDLNKDDTLYLFTDGYADQFGGPKGKKYKYKQLHELLLSNNSKPLEHQKEILISSFETWKGNLEQVDDVCVIGIKI